MQPLIILDASTTSLKLGIVFGLVMMMVGSAFIWALLVEIGRDKKQLWGKSGISLIVAVGLIYFGAKTAHREYGFLTDYQYVEGRTLGRVQCGKSKGIEFEYRSKGQRYTKCTPYTGSGVVAQDGKYWVRVWNGDPEGGRIEFERPVEE